MRRTNWLAASSMAFGMALLLLVIGSQNVWAQNEDRRGRGIGARAGSPAQSRHAIVIGNSDYATIEQLNNPVNDANDMSAVLEQLGFSTNKYVNVRQTDFRQLFSRLPPSVIESRVFLFYYAGHGVQIARQNYLIPVDVTINSVEDIRQKAVNLDQLLSKLPRAQNSLNIIILDACRNNPFNFKMPPKRDPGGDQFMSKSKESEQEEVNNLDLTNTIIAYSTQSNSQASDGAGRNGLYTAALLSEIKKPGQNLPEIFQNVRLTVEQKSNREQIPWEESSLKEKFYFVPQESDQDSSLVNNLSAPVRVERQGQWEVVANSTITLRANQPLVDTGISVEPGMSLRINVGGGKISLGNNIFTGAAGIMEQDIRKPLPDCPTGAVIARAGQQYLCVGSQFNRIIQTSGNIWIGINESKLNDNTGSYSVKIEIQKYFVK